jgi:hypothetical protein
MNVRCRLGSLWCLFEDLERMTLQMSRSICGSITHDRVVYQVNQPEVKPQQYSDKVGDLAHNVTM